MCDLALVSGARAAADEILDKHLRRPLRKSLRIDTPRAFDRFVAVLAAELRARAQEHLQEALEAALRVLDVEWGTIPQQNRAAVLRQAVQATRAALKPVAEDIGDALTTAALKVAIATRAAVRESGLAVGATLSALDERMVAHVSHRHTLYIRDAFGRRADEFGQRARDVVTNGLREGLGRDDIAQELRAAAHQAVLGRTGNYWEVVAAAFVGQGRSYAQVSSYSEVGIKAYRIEAVLDERTSDICRFMHGRVFKVAATLRQLESNDALNRTDDDKRSPPWLRQQDETLYIEGSHGRIVVAQVTRSGTGTSNDTGQYSGALPTGILTSYGLTLPPFHCLCRTTTSVRPR